MEERFGALRMNNLEQRHELETIKTLHLETYAQTLGYVRDHEKSSKTVAVLRRASDNDKLLVTQGNGGHWIYRCERDHTDHGTILDFAKSRLGINLGQARQELRKWGNLSSILPKSSTRTNPDKPGQIANVPLCPPVPDTEPDRKKVAAVWGAATWVAEHPYLLQRGIPASTLNDPRFKDCWRLDKRGNCVFPHVDLFGQCGYELRNTDFKGFGERTKKGLWVSANIRTCLQLVVCEAPINCLSFHALRVDEADKAWPMGYAATGGTIGRRQRELIKTLFQRAVDRGCVIVIATDNDLKGEGYVGELAALATVAVERIVPVSKDWNEDLCWCLREQSGNEQSGSSEPNEPLPDEPAQPEQQQEPEQSGQSEPLPDEPLPEPGKPVSTAPSPDLILSYIAAAGFRPCERDLEIALPISRDEIRLTVAALHKQGRIRRRDGRYEVVAEVAP